MSDDKKKGKEGGDISVEALKKAIKGLKDQERKELLAALGASGTGSFITDSDVKKADDYKRVIQATAAAMGDMATAATAQQALLESDFLKQIEDMYKDDSLVDLEKKLDDAREAMEKFKEGDEGALGRLSGLMPDEALKRLQTGLSQTQLLIEAQEAYGKQTDTVAKGIGKLYGLTDQYSTSTLGSLVELSAAFKEGGKQSALASLALRNSLKKIFNMGNIGLNMLNGIKSVSSKMFTNFDNAQAALAKSTAQGDKFRGVLYDMGREGNSFGITMANAGEAIGTMVSQTSNFTSMSKSQQASIGLTVAKMEKLGVATADSAAIFQNFNQGLGMTANESIAMQTELAMAGQSIGISASKITKDFNASLSTLMVYGRESVDVFKGIAAAAKAAGVETSTLLNIASKFDTFSGAAEGAGKLNALLGTQLSTTEMLLATEDERIRMLVESVQAQGVAFQDMDRFSQKAIANAAGITDMAEANRIFGMSLSEYDENEKKLNASTAAQKKLDEAVSKTIPVLDKFKLLGAEIAVSLQPFLETLEAAADGMIKLFQGMDKDTKEMIGNIIGLVGAMLALVPIFKAGGALMTGLKLAGAVILPGVGLGGSVAATGMTAAGTAGAASAPGLAAFAGSMALISIQVIGVVAAVGLAIAAIAMLVQAFGSSEFDFKTAEAEAKLKGFEARTAEAAASIVNGPHEAAVASVAAIVGQMTKLSQDVKVSSTIENLALITAGTSTSITGERVSASQTNVMANVQNSFEGLNLKVKIGEREFDAYMEESYLPKVHGAT